MTILEAMANKKPVVVTDVGGNREAVKNGINGFLVEKGNEYEYYNALKKLINNNQLRKKMGEQGYNIYQEKFTLQKFIQNTESIYLQSIYSR